MKASMKWANICSDNGLALMQRQAFFCLNVNQTLRNTLYWDFNQNILIFIQENVFENAVCKMSTMLSRSQCNGIQQGSPLSPCSISNTKKPWGYILHCININTNIMPIFPIFFKLNTTPWHLWYFSIEDITVLYQSLNFMPSSCYSHTIKLGMSLTMAAILEQSDWYPIILVKPLQLIWR